MALTHGLSTNNYGESRLIVATSAANGTHTTLASAMADAAVGDTIILRNSVTENVTITPGVNIASWNGGTLNTPTITGTLSMTGAGTSNISGIRLQTNSAALLAVTGSAASIINLENCYLNSTNNTGITFSTSSSSAGINIINCRGDIGTTGIGLFAHSSAGTFTMRNSWITNSGGTSTSSTCSAGVLNIYDSFFMAPITWSSTGAGSLTNVSLDTSAQNTTALTADGAGTFLRLSTISSGTASCASVGGLLNIDSQVTLNSSNANVITGAGEVRYGSMDFVNGSSNTINTTTQTALVSRFGIHRSTKQPAFLGYLAAQQDNKTGNGATYTLGTDALTEVFDQNGDFNTNGTFTAPFTGRYNLNASTTVVGCTVATALNLRIITSNRTYIAQNARAAGSANLSANITSICDMDVGDTFTVTIVTVGEAGNTNDILGGSDLYSYMSGNLVC